LGRITGDHATPSSDANGLWTTTVRTAGVGPGQARSVDVIGNRAMPYSANGPKISWPYLAAAAPSFSKFG
jgi:hypothetical protein